MDNRIADKQDDESDPIFTRLYPRGAFTPPHGAQPDTHVQPDVDTCAPCDGIIGLGLYVRS